MEEMSAYNSLKQQCYSTGSFSIVPLRFEDRFEIMKWRNEQMYHLRQSKQLSEEDQQNYFDHVVAHLFPQDRPPQLLFSYLENGECIGYGGLVHINWADKNAEISFIMDTALEKNEFDKNWTIYLKLIEELAFQELKLHKIYTYAFDLRPHLYTVLENNNYTKAAVLREHCFFENSFRDVVIHSKINRNITLREITSKDKEITYEWANDEITRKNSFNNAPIEFEDHENWFTKKLVSSSAHYLICEADKVSAGLIRFDSDSDTTTIGILLDKKFRGMGLAPIFLKKACEEYRQYFTQPIFAFIKKENKASVKSFEKAGFHAVGETIINNFEALKYEYGK